MGAAVGTYNRQGYIHAVGDYWTFGDANVPNDEGTIRYNTSTKIWEGYDGSAWVGLGGGAAGWAGEVANVAALPPAADHAEEYYSVLTSTGFLWKNRKGLYRSDGIVWKRQSNETPSLVDSELEFLDNADNTKKLGFELSSIATGQKRIVTWPDQDISIIDWTNATQDFLTTGSVTAAESYFQTSSAWTPALIIQAAVAQSSDIFQAKDSAGNNIFTVTPTGSMFTDDSFFAGVSYVVFNSTYAHRMTLSHDGTDGVIDTSGTDIKINQTLKTSAGRIVNTTRVTGNTTLDGDNHNVFVDTDGGAVAITIPFGIDGTEYRIINCGSSGNDVTVTPYGSQQIYGSGAGTSITLIDKETAQIVFETTEGWY